VRLRPPRPGDAATLISARDEEFHRFLGAGSPDPRPTAVIELDGEVVGWVDHEGPELHDWLEAGQCNIGYFVVAGHRGRGLAARAVRSLLDDLRREGSWTEAVLLVDAENDASIRVARAVGAVERDRPTNAEGRPQIRFTVLL
jgi:RimJ/RimL family protein N-acetyltransferase